MPLRVWFLNVGHGDCTVVEHASGRVSVVDINNGDDLDQETARELEESYARARLLKYLGWRGSGASLLKEAGYDIELVNPIQFLKAQYPGRDIFRYIQTHPELDHMRGLAALAANGISIANFWDTANTRTDPPAYKNDSDRNDWLVYQQFRAGSVAGVTVLRPTRGARDIFYNEEPKGVEGGDGIYILAPTAQLAQIANEAGKHNVHSFVLMLMYRGRRIILGGDADEEVWDSIVTAYGDRVKCDVLKASHHGRDSGFHKKALELMSPRYVVVSVGKKPETDASSKYRVACANVWSTRWMGTMSVSIADDGVLSWTADHPDRG